jgi:hypothetical protein
MKPSLMLVDRRAAWKGRRTDEASNGTFLRPGGEAMSFYIGKTLCGM